MKHVSRQKTNQLLEMIEQGLLDKDNVILACVKYMSEDDVAEMMRINEMLPDEEPDWDTYDSRDYDVEAMKIDHSNGNFDADNSGDYLWTGIIAESLSNGQFEQAKDQCAHNGFDYESVLAKFNSSR